MKKRILVFFSILLCMTFIPILIFPRNTSVEDAQYALAVEIFKEGRYNEAIEEFDRLLVTMKTKKYPDACHYYIGSSYYYLKDYKRAKPNFETVVKKYRPGSYHSESLYLLGRCELMMGNYSMSIRYFDEYVRRYPKQSYADNSLYWKAEALISMDDVEAGRRVLGQLLDRYPYGNKADAARFKLRLMELEERIAEQQKRQRESGSGLGGEGEEAYIDEIAGLKEREKSYQDEIKKLNNRVDQLKTQIDTLKRIAEASEDEEGMVIQEKLQVLASWENLLGLKEQALTEKERELDREYEWIVRVKKQLEGKADE